MVLEFERDRYRASTHYVWRQDPADILGEGAYGSVYRGFHKETCETVAIKTFNKLSLKRPNSVQMRELNILEKLDHPNVVRLIAVEEELTSTLKYVSQKLPTPQGGSDSLEGKVLIMEMCTEGNLYSIIEQPENQFGLDETEFLRVLSHTTGGMKYLHENKIVHRDWKPSNILKTVTAEGDIVYKLCDFGAARELEENQPFLSIVGTEEYIPPEIYGRALLGHSAESFLATSELWSFGVTLYHVATGQLPFKPFGGRKNRETMYKIISSKQSGVISGVQEIENGPINWSTTLPRHCRFSRQCKLFLTHLLSNLLETNRQKIWSFDRFFDEVDNFLSKLRIFCVAPDCVAEVVYLNKAARFEEAFETICQQFNFQNEETCDALLFHNSKLFDRLSSTQCSFDVGTLAASSCKHPLLVIHGVATNLGGLQLGSIQNGCEFPLDVTFPEAPNNLTADYDYANRCSALVFWALQMAKERVKCREICINANETVSDFITKTLNLIDNRCTLLLRYWSLINSSLIAVKFMINGMTLESAQKHCRQTKEALDSEQANIEAIKSKWTETKAVPFLVSHSNILTVLDRSVCSMFEILMQFRNDRVLARHPSESHNNELKWHGLLKQQLRNNWNRVKQQYENDVVARDMKKLHLLLDSAAKFHSKVQLSMQSLDLAEKMVVTLDNSMRQILLMRYSMEHGDLPKNGILAGQNEQSAKDASLVSNLTDSLLGTVQDLKELRKIAQKNRSIFAEFLSLTDQGQ